MNRTPGSKLAALGGFILLAAMLTAATASAQSAQPLQATAAIKPQTVSVNVATVTGTEAATEVESFQTSRRGR